jgi:glucosamine-phosphate N-acetyltransferase
MADEIVGYGAVVIEVKIRGGVIAHIEDICTAFKFRGIGIGGLILESLFEISRKYECYKLVLSCKLNNIDFYSGNLYEQDGISMSRFIY